MDRWHRDAYLRALDGANSGSLADLTSLFVKLEGAALTSELERPPETDRPGIALDVAHSLAAQLARVKRDRDEALQLAWTARAIAVSGRLEAWFDRKKQELAQVFRQQGVPEVVILAGTQRPPSERAQWFRAQIIDSAHAAGHYADFHHWAGWSDLRIRLERWQLRYVASLHGAGRDPGVMAVTTFAEIELIESQSPADASEQAVVSREPIRTTSDAFRFVHSETVDQINGRAAELEALLDEGLAVALTALLRRV